MAPPVMTLSSSSVGRLQIWDRATDRLRASIETPDPPRSEKQATTFPAAVGVLAAGAPAETNCARFKSTSTRAWSSRGSNGLVK